MSRGVVEFLSHLSPSLDPRALSGLPRQELQMAHNRTTGKKAASAAGKVLANPKSTKEEKSAAASTLSQVHGKDSSKGKK
jgi:hypothetical protein